MGGLFGGGSMSADALSRQLSKSITLTVADMAEIPALNDAVNDLAFALQSDDQNTPARARTYAQSFTSIFGSSVPASYIDLSNFAQLIKKQSDSSAVDKAADKVVAQVQKVVIAEKHGSEKPGANGIAAIIMLACSGKRQICEILRIRSGVMRTASYQSISTPGCTR